MTRADKGQADPDTTRVVGCAVRGPSHERDSVPCQDEWAADTVADSQLVIAVGDGLGSAELSHRGSKRATREVVDRLGEFLRSGGAIDETHLEPVVKETFSAARDAVREEAAEAEEPLSAFRTTLLAVVAGPGGGAAAAVGDGGMVGERDGEQFPLVPREQSEYANVTRPVTDENWEKGYRFEFHERLDAVAVFSDGLDPFAWTSDGGRTPQDAFFDQVFAFIRDVSDPAEAKPELRAFLDDDHFREYSRDDKTLVVGRIAADGTRGGETEPEQEPESESATGSESEPNTAREPKSDSHTQHGRASGREQDDPAAEATEAATEAETDTHASERLQRAERLLERAKRRLGTGDTDE